MSECPCLGRYTLYPLDTICVGDFSDTDRTIRRMAEWYERAKERMAELGVTQNDLMSTFGVTTRGAVGHYLSGRRDPPSHLLVALADRLFLSLDKALRNKGLKYDAAVVAPALLLAYRERLAFPKRKLLKREYPEYDQVVLEKLQGEIDEESRRSRQTSARGSSVSRKTSSSRA
jgi:transcriptional regulator with XRE-family HTH domain